MKLGIGTAQFGLDYGVSNKEGQVSPAEVKRILEDASQLGIQYIDTAALYGNSEQVLGASLPTDHLFRIVTKTTKLPYSSSQNVDISAITEGFSCSLARMKQQQLYGLLVHDCNDLLSSHGNDVYRILESLKSQKLVEKIGVSVYESKQIDEILTRYSIDIIQIPINVFDQRLIHSGHLQKLKQTGVEIHARSAFLQGLILMDPDDLPSYFQSVRNHVISFREYIFSQGISPLEAALSFLNHLQEIDVIVCGLENCTQLYEIWNAAKKPVKKLDFSRFSISDESIVNPALWRKK